MMKIFSYFFRPMLSAPQKFPDIGYQLVSVAGTLASYSIGLDIVIEKFVWIEVGAVTRQEEQSNFLLMSLDPPRYPSRFVHRMSVDNEENFPPGVSYQPPKKVQENRCFEALVEYHKRQLSTIGDSRNHVASKPLSRPHNDRGLPTPSITPPCLIIRSHSRFVSPVNRRSFAFGVIPNTWILFPQPLFDNFWVLFVGAAQWFLRCKSPSFEIPPHRPNRKPNTKSAGYEIPHRFSCPKSKWKFELIGATLGNQTNCRGGLPGSQLNLRWPTTRSRTKRPNTILAPTTMPAIDRLSRNPENTRRFCLGHFLLNCFDYASSKCVQSNRRQTSSISLSHFADYILSGSMCQTFSAPISKRHG